PGPGVQIEPVENPVGVPEFYLLHVLNPKLVLTATAPAPPNGVVGGIATFTLKIDGGAPVSVTLPVSDENGTNNNNTVADLIQDLNGALATANLALQVRAGQDGQGRLTLTRLALPNQANASLEIGSANFFTSGSLKFSTGLRAGGITSVGQYAI